MVGCGLFVGWRLCRYEVVLVVCRVCFALQCCSVAVPLKAGVHSRLAVSVGVQALVGCGVCLRALLMGLVQL